MTLPTAYLTTSKNLESIFNAIRTAKAPPRFTGAFLESLEFKSSSDRLIIGVLKSVGLITDQGVPTERYFQFLDQTQSGYVLAAGIEEAYRDLFQVNRNANELTQADIKNKIKTLTQGQLGESVLDKMAMTFRSLCDLADFSRKPVPDTETHSPPPASDAVRPLPETHVPPKIGGLVYNIQIHLPESRDHSVYDALFKSLREHLLQ